MTAQEMRDAAYRLLSERPMKAKEIAVALGLPNARSLSLALQWDRRLINDGRRWRIQFKK